MQSILLSTILIFPIIGVFYLLISPREDESRIKKVALSFSLQTFLLVLVLWFLFDKSSPDFQFEESVGWLPSLGMNCRLGVDGFSIYFVVLTTFLVPFCLLTGWTSVTTLQKEYCIAFLILESCMLGVFLTLDLLVFYIFFESVLIPMFVIVGIWGSRERKIRAAYQLFLYTLAGSLFLLLAIVLIYYQTGTTDIQILHEFTFSEERQIILWFAMFCSFAVKIPMIPVHIWLPEAHVEAPTAGSVILAGVLLKLGGYGFLRLSMPLFPLASIYYTPLIFTLSLIGVTYASLTTLRQIDLKKIIAYSSVAHMAFVTLGLFTFNLQGICGAILLMLSHGIVSSALFLCIGVLYDRHKTRIVKYYGGLARTMPIFSIIFLLFTLGNLGLPGTSSFPGELLVLIGTFQVSKMTSIIASSGMVLGGAYSIWLYNRVVFGQYKAAYIDTSADINRREFWIFFPLILCMFIFGIFPDIILEGLNATAIKFTCS